MKKVQITLTVYPELIDSIDEKAKLFGISRNAFFVQAAVKELIALSSPDEIEDLSIIHKSEEEE